MITPYREEQLFSAARNGFSDSTPASSLNMPPESGWLPCLARINHEFLPGYHAETVKRLGYGHFAGLHSEVNILIGPFITSTMILRVFIRDGDDEYPVISMFIPVDEVQGSILVNDYASNLTDDTPVGRLLNHVVHPLNQLRNGHEAVGDSWSKLLQQPNNDDDFVSDARPATFIQRATDKIRLVKLKIPIKTVKFLHPRQSPETERNMPPECSLLKEAFLSEFVTWHRVMRLSLYFRADETLPKLWKGKMTNRKFWSTPYARVGPSSMGALGPRWSTSQRAKGFRPDHPIPACTVFMSDQQRYISLLHGASELDDVARLFFNKLASTNFDVAVIRDRFSEQKSILGVPDNGIGADQPPPRQYFVLSSRDTNYLLPKIGERCIFEHHQRVHEYDFPKTGAHGQLLKHLARRIWKTTEPWSHIRGAPFPAMFTRSGYRFHILRVILPLIISSPEELERRDVEDPHRATEVEDLVRAMKISERIEGERFGDDEECSCPLWFLQWVQKNVKRIVFEGNDRSIVMWEARRIPLPPGSPADIALFSVSTAADICWPYLFKAPFVPSLPVIDPQGELDQFLQTVAEQLGRANGEMATTVMKLRPMARGTSNTFGPEAMTLNREMDKLPAVCPARLFWNYALDFRYRPEPLLFRARFPQLQKDMDSGLFSESHAEALRHLTEVYGYAFLDAASGPETNGLVARICRSLVRDRGRVVVIAPTDALVRDAYQRIAEAMPRARIVHLLPWGVEIHNITASPSDLTSIDVSDNLGTPADKALAEHYLSSRKSRLDKTQACRVEGSLSNTVIDMILKNDRCELERLRDVDSDYGAEFGGDDEDIDSGDEGEGHMRGHRHNVHDGHDPYHDYGLYHNPISSITRAGLRQLGVSEADYEKMPPEPNGRQWEADNLLKQALPHIDVLCATPQSFTRMMQDGPRLDPSLIIMHTAEKLSEVSSFLPATKFPETPHLFIGDSQQPGPPCPSLDNELFKSIFGRQRAMSLFKRVHEAGQMPISLPRSPGDKDGGECEEDESSGGLYDGYASSLEGYECS